MTAQCSERVIHPAAVEEAREGLPQLDELAGMGEFFKVLGDPTRLKILHALTRGELCVCDLSVVLGMSVSAVSHQLSVLRQARLLSFRREGKVIFYALGDDHVKGVLESIRVHLSE
jgi:DNA-binding transcriptional ArsR family regulator